MQVVAIIPARGGSKRLPDKNILRLAGKPVIGYTIEAALAAKRVDTVVVSTDSRAIAGVVRRRYPVEVIMRPPELARDDSPIEGALLHAVEYLRQAHAYRADIVVWLQANVPLRAPGMIDTVVRKLANSDADACVTCYEVDQIPELMKRLNDRGRLVPLCRGVRGIRKQEFAARYLLDGAVIAFRAGNLAKTRGIRRPHAYLLREIIPVVQPERKYSVEIDAADDFALARFHLQQMRAGARRGGRR